MQKTSFGQCISGQKLGGFFLELDQVLMSELIPDSLDELKQKKKKLF